MKRPPALDFTSLLQKFLAVNWRSCKFSCTRRRSNATNFRLLKDAMLRATSKKKQDKAPTPCEEEQYKRFIEAAREFECDENVEALERAVREIVPRKSASGSLLQRRELSGR
jgi:hypothetical protein